MTDARSDGISVRRTERGEVWSLPRRSPRLFLGGFFLFLTSLGSAFAWILGSPAFGGEGGPAPPWVRAAAGALALACLLPLTLGLAFLRSRGSLLLERDRVGWREHGGFLRWTRWRDLTAVRAVGWDRSEPGVARPVLRCEGAPELPLAHVDPEPLGHTLARLLAEQLDVPLEPLDAGVRSAPEATEEGVPSAAPAPGDGSGSEPSTRRRPGSTEEPETPGSGKRALPSTPSPPAVRVRDEDGRSVLHVPPRGLLRGSNGLFPFGCVWLAFTSVLATVFALSDQATGDTVPLVLFFALFFAVGAGMLLAGWSAGRREVWLEVGGDGTLTCRRVGPLGRRELEVRAEDLRGVRVGDSNLRVNNRVVRQLEVRHARGRWTALRNLDDGDLEWVRDWLVARLEPGEPSA